MQHATESFCIRIEKERAITFLIVLYFIYIQIELKMNENRKQNRVFYFRNENIKYVNVTQFSILHWKRWTKISWSMARRTMCTNIKNSSGRYVLPDRVWNWNLYGGKNGWCRCCAMRFRNTSDRLQWITIVNLYTVPYTVSFPPKSGSGHTKKSDIYFLHKSINLIEFSARWRIDCASMCADDFMRECNETNSEFTTTTTKKLWVSVHFDQNRNVVFCVPFVDAKKKQKHNNKKNCGILMLSTE